jgi:hypothetical protein
MLLFDECWIICYGSVYDSVWVGKWEREGLVMCRTCCLLFSLSETTKIRSVCYLFF